MRVGMGYDVHKLVEGRDLILGGVKIPYEKWTSWSFGCRCIITCNHGCCFWGLQRLVI